MSNSNIVEYQFPLSNLKFIGTHKTMSPNGTGIKFDTITLSIGKYDMRIIQREDYHSLTFVPNLIARNII